MSWLAWLWRPKPSTADAIVYRDGDQAVAVDRWGRLIEASTDHAGVIQAAIDYVYKIYGGGTVYVLPGTYTLAAQIPSSNVYGYVELIGSGHGTLLKSSGFDALNLAYIRARKISYTDTNGNTVYVEDSSKNSGKATFSGDGSTTQFSIAHGLASAPSKVVVTPCSADASGSFYVTVDDTYIYVNYATAPAAGTDNVCLYWEAEI